MLWWTLWQLKSKNTLTRRKAVEKLGDSGDARAVKHLLRALTDNDSTVRNAAIIALGNTGNVQAVKPLVNALNNKKVERRLVIEALVKLGALAAEPLVGALKRKEASIRAGAAEVLGKIGNRPYVEPLISALEDNDASVRSMAAHVLGQMGDRQAVEPLAAMLTDQSRNVRSTAAIALKALRWQPADDVQRAYLAVLLGKWNEVANIGAAAVEALLLEFNAPETSSFASNRRQSIVVALGKTGDARVVSPLVAALKDKDENVRVSAAESLAIIGDPRAIEPLVRILEDARGWVMDDRVARAAMGALAKIGKPSVEPLLLALAGKNVRARIAATKTLAEIGGEQVVDGIAGALKDEDRGVRVSAAEALGKIRDARAVEPLVASLDDEDSYVQEVATTALGDIGDTRAVEPLITILNSKRSESIRESAVSALRKLKDARAVEPLIAALNLAVNEPDRDTKMIEALVIALGDSHDARAVMALVNIAKTPSQYADLTISCLEELLGHAAGRSSTDDLREVAMLENIVRLRLCTECVGGELESWYDRYPVDSSRVKQLARQELIRRGLKA